MKRFVWLERLYWERLYFAEDMIMYFMKTYKIQWNPGKQSAYYPRWFTKSMGYVARHLALTKKDAVNRRDESSPFCLKSNNLPRFTNGYNTEDFLHYCGLMALNLIFHCRNGDSEFIDVAVMLIYECLNEVIQDGSFLKSGGLDALTKFADSKFRYIGTRMLAESILFADDLMKYFMDRSQERWISGTDIFVWNGHRRRFNEAIGSAAFWLSQFPISCSRFSMDGDDVLNLKRLNGYYPRYFLQYCGKLASSSVTNLSKGNHKYPEVAIGNIVDDLLNIYHDDYFHLSGGWDELTEYAKGFQLYLIYQGIPYLFHYRQKMLEAENCEEIQQEEDDTLIEEQYIGTLLKDL